MDGVSEREWDCVMDIDRNRVSEKEWGWVTRTAPPACTTIAGISAVTEKAAVGKAKPCATAAIGTALTLTSGSTWLCRDLFCAGG